MTGDVVIEGEEVVEGEEEGEREEVGGRGSGDAGDGMFDRGEDGRSGEGETRQGTSGDAHSSNETGLYWQIEDCQYSSSWFSSLPLSLSLSLSLPPSLCSPTDPSSREAGTDSGLIITPLPIPPSLTNADTTSTTDSSADESTQPLSAGKHCHCNNTMYYMYIHVLYIESRVCNTLANQLLYVYNYIVPERKLMYMYMYIA